jgi:hypothetical protein
LCREGAAEKDATMVSEIQVAKAREIVTMLGQGKVWEGSNVVRVYVTSSVGVEGYVQIEADGHVSAHKGALKMAIKAGLV